MTAPGPTELGRGVVVAAGADPPAPWTDAPRVRVDDAALADPEPVVERLHGAWSSRRPVVVELAVDAGEIRTPVSHRVEPWEVDPGFHPWRDMLHFLVWANTYDARAGEPVWWWGRKAARLDATEGGPADVVLPDGAPAWVDGGPRSDGRLADHLLVHAETVDAGRLDPVPASVAVTADLDPEQLEAVAHGAGPARVIAPAGSGKTRVLTERLRHLVADRGYETSSLLALAYNKQAQLEMVDRTGGLGARVRTLNAWGYELVGRILGRRPQVIEEREIRSIVEKLVPRPQRRVNTDPYARYLEGLSLIRLGLRSPARVETEFGDVPGLAAAFGPFRAELSRRGVVDFDEQVYLAIEHLLADGGLRRALQAEHRHLLVDEFQDLTPAHLLLIRLLACPAYDVFGVGDDDQTIYSHAGADPRFLVDYDRYFPGAGHHALQINYRCPRPVTEAAGRLLSYNTVRVEKVIRSGPDVAVGATGMEVKLHPTDAGVRELVKLVRGWLDAGTAPEDVAVLARVNSLLLGPHVALADAGVALDSIVDGVSLARLGVRAALAYLRLAVSPGSLDPADLVEVHRRPSRGLPQWVDKWLGRCRSIEDVRRAADKIDDLKVPEKLLSLAGDLDELARRAADGASTRDLLTAVRDEVGLGRAMSLLDSTGVAAASHLDDLEGLLQVADLHPDPSGFEPWLRRAFAAEHTEGGVTLSTVHRVKGREWPMVAVFGANGGILPHRLSVGLGPLEEERRILHVAITRSSRQTVVLADGTRPSPFLAELDGTAPRAPSPDPPDAAAETPIPAMTLDEGDPVVAALKAWRTERARADQVPPYVVMWDRHLAGIAERRPRDLDELAACPGIGRSRLVTYGDAILEAIRSATEG